MKIRVAVAILLLAMLATSPMLVMIPLPVKAGGVNSSYITLSDTYMANDWTKQWGAGTNTIDDIPGPGVEFNFTGTDKAAVGQGYPVNIPGVGDDLSGYGGFELYLKNQGASGLDAHLYMNTGYTGGGADPENDTFWGGDWISLNPGETKLCILNFSYAEAWNIWDDPDWPGTDGESYAVFRLDEVTAIGLEVGFDDDFSVVAFGSTNPELYVDPPTVNKAPADNATTFTVDIVIENFTDFYAFDINMTWDGGLLEFVSVEYTTYLNALWGAYPAWMDVVDENDVGTYNLVATKLGTGGVSDTGAYILFRLTLRIIETCNFPLETAIHFEVVKLSDSATPVPNKIIPVVTDGMYYMSATMPSLSFTLVEPDGHPWEESKTFEVEVWVHDIHDCSPLEDYDLTIDFDPGLAVYTGITWNATFGTGTVTPTGTPTDTLQVVCVGGPVWGDQWLFTLTFHVEYGYEPEHVWKYLVNEQDAFGIRMTMGELSFGSLGTLDELVFPSGLTVDVYFIRGDVDSNGEVDIFDLQAVGYNYGSPGPSIYDLNNDNLIDIFDIVALATNYGYGS